MSVAAVSAAAVALAEGTASDQRVAEVDLAAMVVATACQIWKQGV